MEICPSLHSLLSAFPHVVGYRDLTRSRLDFHGSCLGTMGMKGLFLSRSAVSLMKWSCPQQPCGADTAQIRTNLPGGGTSQTLAGEDNHVHYKWFTGRFKAMYRRFALSSPHPWFLLLSLVSLSSLLWNPSEQDTAFSYRVEMERFKNLAPNIQSRKREANANLGPGALNNLSVRNNNAVRDGYCCTRFKVKKTEAQSAAQSYRP